MTEEKYFEFDQRSEKNQSQYKNMMSNRKFGVTHTKNSKYDLIFFFITYLKFSHGKIVGGEIIRKDFQQKASSSMVTL